MSSVVDAAKDPIAVKDSRKHRLIWHDGEDVGGPPSIGWWMATSYRIPGRWRWWNGEGWTVYVKEDAASDLVKLTHESPTHLKIADIDWCDHLPDGPMDRTNPYLLPLNRATSNT